MSRTKGAKDKKPRVMPKTGEARGCTKDHNPKLPEGWNSRQIAFMREVAPFDRPPLDKYDVAEMERRFIHYLECCEKYDMKVSNLAAYAAIGIDKDQAKDWEKFDKLNPERSRFIKKVRSICGLYREALMADGKVNPVTGIFWQKNYDHLSDQQEIVITPNNPMGEQTSPEELSKRYIEQTYGQEQIEAHETIPEDLTADLDAEAELSHVPQNIAEAAERPE